MRHKTTPVSLRGARRPEASPRHDGTPRRSSPLWDWALTLPVVALLPVILVPILAVAAAGPSLSVTGPAEPGKTIVVTGINFPKREYVQLAWDGKPAPWLAVTKTDRSGVLQVNGVVPPGTAPGAHTLGAWLKQNGRNSRVEGSPAAQLTVTIAGAPSAAPATPEPTPAATPVPTAKPTASSSPTASPTPRPTATPTASATPSPTPTTAPRPPEAPSGAIGYGSATVGGAGGRVIRVTNLADSGAGSLRAAVEASGPRTVVFAVGGTIQLSSDLKISDPFVTVAGETAPSPVVVRGAGTVVRTHEVIIRNVRFRPGDEVDSPGDVDALTLNGMSGGVHNVVVDHVSMVWGPDIGGLAVLGDVRNVTVSNSIMGEGLYRSRHPEGTEAQGGHSHAANLTQLDGGSAWPRNITFVGNLFTTSDTRIPRLQGAECVDLVNNVIYNWGKHAGHGNPRSLNMVNNYFRAGPESQSSAMWNLQTSAVSPTPFSAAVYLSGNQADGFTPSTGDSASVFARSVRCGGLSVAAAAPDAAYRSVLANAGAVLPSRDAVDARIIANVVRRAGSFFNGAGQPGPTPYWP